MGEQSTAVRRAQEPETPRIVSSETLAERVDSVFDHVARLAYQMFERNGRRDGHHVEDWLAAERELLGPVAVETNDAGESLQIRAGVQGFTPKELEISVEPRKLTIAGKHEAREEGTDGKAAYAGELALDILRIVPLPAEVDPAKVAATMKDGVLDVTLPKAAGPRPVPENGTEEREAEVAKEMQEEMDQREELRLEDERAEQEDLNQGMATGTHDSTHRGVNWPSSYRIRSK